MKKVVAVFLFAYLSSALSFVALAKEESLAKEDSVVAGVELDELRIDYELIGQKRHRFYTDFCGWSVLAPIAIPEELK